MDTCLINDVLVGLGDGLGVKIMSSYLINDFLVGLGEGLGVKELLFTGICMEGEKHCCKKRNSSESMTAQ